jgi:hypothetical protein
MLLAPLQRCQISRARPWNNYSGCAWRTGWDEGRVYPARRRVDLESIELHGRRVLADCRASQDCVHPRDKPFSLAELGPLDAMRVA